MNLQAWSFIKNRRHLFRAEWDNPFSWSMVERCFASALIFAAFHISYLAYYLYASYYPETNPEVNQAFLPFVTRLIVVIIGCDLILLSIAFVKRKEDSSASILTNCCLFVFVITLIYSNYFFGFFTHLFSGMAILTSWVMGLILFSKNKMIISLVAVVYGLAITLLATHWGYLSYAPFFNPTMYTIGNPNPTLLSAMNLVTTILYACVIIVIYHLIERWKERDQNNQLVTIQLEKANQIISRYVANRLQEHIQADDINLPSALHQRRNLTLFFSQIDRFAEIADNMDPQLLTRNLNHYLSEMSLIANRYNATIDKIVGDAIMIFFNTTTAHSEKEQALFAVRMAIEMQARMILLRESWRREAVADLFHIRIGINTGSVNLATYEGYERSKEFSAIGQQVKIAARLQAACAPDHILLSHSSWILVNDQIPCSSSGNLDISGERQSIPIYAVSYFPKNTLFDREWVS